METNFKDTSNNEDYSQERNSDFSFKLFQKHQSVGSHAGYRPYAKQFFDYRNYGYPSYPQTPHQNGDKSNSNNSHDSSKIENGASLHGPDTYLKK